MIVVQHPVHFQVTQKGVRPRAAPSSPPITCYLLPVTSRRASGTAGMTMIELGIVMGIVSALLALILGLSRHVNETVKIRRAQTELGEWHESLNRWHLQFGEYPYARIDTQNDTVIPFDFTDWTFATPNRYPLAILTNDTAASGCYTLFVHGDTPTNITFRSFLTSAVSIVDPWGTPYIYTPSENALSYTLFSCGPDAKTILPDGTKIPSDAPTKPDPTYDDIYFER